MIKIDIIEQSVKKAIFYIRRLRGDRMDYLIDLFKRETIKRVTVFLIIGILFYCFKSMANLLLLTFVITYLMYSLINFIHKFIEKFVPIKKNLVTVIVYVAILSFIGVVISKYSPIVVKQSKVIVTEISEIGQGPNPTKLETYIKNYISRIDVEGYMQDGVEVAVKLATNLGKWSVNAFIAIILSLFFMLEQKKVHDFMDKFKDSKIKSFYKYLSMFGREFLDSFGKVIQAQILIAFTNTILSILFLWIMGFPQLLALGVMIFILSLIPVAGVIISLIPLSLIAYNIGGVVKILYVLIMVGAIHGLESYVLNPKFMSDKTELPVFFTFVILIVSEHLLGVWGLLIGIPLFIFILNLLGVKFSSKKKIIKPKLAAKN